MPQLVPKQDLTPAISANSVGFNISRAIGPALGGAVIAGFGIAARSGSMPSATSECSARCGGGAPANRRSSLAGGARRQRHHDGHSLCPAQSASARHIDASCRLFPDRQAYWALLPLVARNQIAGGPQLYGILLGAIGAGAVGGAFVLPSLKAKLGPDRLVAAGTLGTAVALVLFGLAHDVVIALVASLIAGAAWIGVLATLNVSAQVALPEWCGAAALRSI